MILKEGASDTDSELYLNSPSTLPFSDNLCLCSAKAEGSSTGLYLNVLHANVNSVISLAWWWITSIFITKRPSEKSK